MCHKNIISNILASKRWFATQRASNASIFHFAMKKLRASRAYKSEKRKRTHQQPFGRWKWKFRVREKAKVIWKIGNLNAEIGGKCERFRMCTLQWNIYLLHLSRTHTTVLVIDWILNFMDGVWVSECEWCMRENGIGGIWRVSRQCVYTPYIRDKVYALFGTLCHGAILNQK